MEKLKDFLHRKDIEISVKRYGIDALGVAIHQTDCQNHDNGNGAISEGYLERNIVLVHEKSFKMMSRLISCSIDICLQS